MQEGFRTGDDSTESTGATSIKKKQETSPMSDSDFYKMIAEVRVIPFLLGARSLLTTLKMNLSSVRSSRR